MDWEPPRGTMHLYPTRIEPVIRRPPERDSGDEAVPAVEVIAPLPVARIAANVPWPGKEVIDAGALGIAVPMIRSREEAEAPARLWVSARWRTHVGPFYEAMRWDMPMRDYMLAAADKELSMITIEHVGRKTY